MDEMDGMEGMGRTGEMGEVDRLLKRGVAYCIEGLVDRGLECYNEAIGVDPSRADCYVYRGSASQRRTVRWKITRRP
jgi:hypothetical protein